MKIKITILYVENLINLLKHLSVIYIWKSENYRYFIFLKKLTILFSDSSKMLHLTGLLIYVFSLVFNTVVNVKFCSFLW